MVTSVDEGRLVWVLANVEEVGVEVIPSNGYKQSMLW